MWHGQITLRTARWSINIPTWLNPKDWAHWLGDRLAASVGGRTSPWTCPNDPGWLWVASQTSTVHACAQRNDDPQGQRAEVRIKANRGAVQEVTLAGPRDYAWVNGQPDLVRNALGAVTRTDPGSVVFLAPGDDGLMTVGYRRPSVSQQYTMTVQTTYRSVILNLVYYLVTTPLATRRSSPSGESRPTR